MDNKILFKQLFDGSKAQRARYKKEGLTKQLKNKILEGNTNSLRTIKIRLFILQFQNRALWLQLCPMVPLMREFQEAIECENKEKIKQIIKRYEEKITELNKLRMNQPLREASYITQVLLILTLTISLFKEINPINYNKEIFSKQNRYSPLNVFFPFKL